MRIIKHDQGYTIHATEAEFKILKREMWARDMWPEKVVEYVMLEATEVRTDLKTVSYEDWCRAVGKKS
jgi:hypothetical protein